MLFLQIQIINHQILEIYVTCNNNGSTIGKSRRRSSSSAPTDKPVGKILRPIAKVLPVYSPNNSNDNNKHG